MHVPAEKDLVVQDLFQILGVSQPEGETAIALHLTDERGWEGDHHLSSDLQETVLWVCAFEDCVARLFGRRRPEVHRWAWPGKCLLLVVVVMGGVVRVGRERGREVRGEVGVVAGEFVIWVLTRGRERLSLRGVPSLPGVPPRIEREGRSHDGPGPSPSFSSVRRTVEGIRRDTHVRFRRVVNREGRNGRREYWRLVIRGAIPARGEDLDSLLPLLAQVAG